MMFLSGVFVPVASLPLELRGVACTLLLTYSVKALRAALAYDHRNDIFSALAATVGIFFGRMGYLWVDPLAGALVALIILRTGIEILRESAADLMDTLPGRALAQQITESHSYLCFFYSSAWYPHFT